MSEQRAGKAPPALAALAGLGRAGSAAAVVALSLLVGDGLLGFLGASSLIAAGARLAGASASFLSFFAVVSAVVGVGCAAAGAAGVTATGVAAAGAGATTAGWAMGSATAGLATSLAVVAGAGRLAAAGASARGVSGVPAALRFSCISASDTSKPTQKNSEMMSKTVCNLGAGAGRASAAASGVARARTQAWAQATIVSKIKAAVIARTSQPLPSMSVSTVMTNVVTPPSV